METPGNTPTDIVFALATISVALPHTHPTSSAKLAAIIAACQAHAWSEESQTALARQATDWLAISHWLAEPIGAVQRYEPTVLLHLLREMQASATESSHVRIDLSVQSDV